MSCTAHSKCHLSPDGEFSGFLDEFRRAGNQEQQMRATLETEKDPEAGILSLSPSLKGCWTHSQFRWEAIHPTKMQTTLSSHFVID